MPSTAELELVLGHTFERPELLRLALTHPSIAHEQGGGQQHNQRLEFLGDAVLQLVLTAELYEKFPNLGEGPLTQARAQMVNRTSLALQARRLSLGDHLVLSRGEESSGGRHRTSTVADAFEALIGAVYLDAGYDTTRSIVLRLFRGAFGELLELPSLDNPKGELQELLQSASPEPPRYEILSAVGPDHDRCFECAVYHHGVELGRGMGRSKKTAEGQAAFNALHSLRKGANTPPPPPTPPAKQA